jgi:hypothetical protein
MSYNLTFPIQNQLFSSCRALPTATAKHVQTASKKEPLKQNNLVYYLLWNY